MIKLPKINVKDLIPVDEIKQFFSKERISAICRKENFSSDKILTALRSDGYSITYLALFIGTVIAIISWSSSGVGLAQVITLSLFAYFNAFLFVYLIRHRSKINWSLAGWSCLAVFLIAIGIFILIYSAFKSWDSLLSSTMTVGLVAFPVMAFDQSFRQRVIGPCFSTFFSAVEGCFSGGSIESIFGGILGTALLGVALIMVMLAGGAIGAVAFYIGSVTGLLLLSEKFASDAAETAKEESVQQLPDGCIDGDAVNQVGVSSASAVSNVLSEPQGGNEISPCANQSDDTIVLD